LAPRIPTGPVMVLVATGIFIFSAIFAPRRGVLARGRRMRANTRRENRQHLLRALVELEELHPTQRAFSLEALTAELQWPQRRVTLYLRRLGRQKLISPQDGAWALEESGRAEGVFVVKSHRLWEHYLVYRDILAQDHVDRSADEVEHLLTPQIITRLEEILLQEKQMDPRDLANIHADEGGSRYRQGGRDE
jgi:manganese/zinc/iron transport system permease protein